MRIISFLGTGKYETTTYYWNDGGETKEFGTHLICEALYRIFEADVLTVFATSKAREAKGHDGVLYVDYLRSKLGNAVEIGEIPDGKNESEIWAIFDACVEVVNEGEEVILDVTHAFRSIPIIVFAVSAYLRRIKDVKLRGILYGAYDVKEEDNRTPIFDLTSLSDLLDWLHGLDFFMRCNEAKLLADQLRKTQSRQWRNRGTSPDETLPRKLRSMADGLQNLSDALNSTRPLEAMARANSLPPIFEEIAEETKRWAKPFNVVIDRLHNEIKRLAHPAPEILTAENLEKQINLVEHYLEKNMIAQAILLAREWMVSYLVFQVHPGSWLSKDFRGKMEEVLGDAQLGMRTAVRLPDWFESLPGRREITKNWNWIINLRNDLAHCGMKASSAGATSINSRAKQIPDRLRSMMNLIENSDRSRGENG